MSVFAASQEGFFQEGSSDSNGSRYLSLQIEIFFTDYTKFKEWDGWITARCSSIFLQASSTYDESSG